MEDYVTESEVKEKEVRSKPIYTLAIMVIMGLTIIIGGSFLMIKMDSLSKDLQIVTQDKQVSDAALHASTEKIFELEKELSKERMSTWAKVKSWWNDEDQDQTHKNKKIIEQKEIDSGYWDREEKSS